jgi:hypothetical protein
MKKLLPFVFIFLLHINCKKSKAIIANVQEDILITAMTNGSWKITYFTENAIATNAFDGFDFKYYKDLTVDATSTTSIITKGTWNGSSATKTTFANFNVTSTNPLIKLNGTWKIVKNTNTTVDLEQTDGILIKLMYLQKK